MNSFDVGVIFLKWDEKKGLVTEVVSDTPAALKNE
jgi:hypothetical protein